MNDGGASALRSGKAATRLRAVLAAASSILAADNAFDEVHVRRATINDLDDIVALENAAFATDRVSARQWRHHLESLSAEVLLAIRDRQVVGAAMLLFHRRHRVVRLYSIAVAAAERGRRIGERLLHAAELAAARREGRALRLEVRADNAAAQHLYERNGYRPIGERPGYYEDGATALRYEKTLQRPYPVVLSSRAD